MSSYTQNEVNRATGRIWIGSKPPCGEKLSKTWNTLILAAEEYQPEPECFKDIDIVYAPLDDSGNPMTEKETVIAKQAGIIVAGKIAKFETILSTCMAGLNRSTFIAALGILYSGMIRDPDEIIRKMRKARSEWAFSNPYFEKFLRQEARNLELNFWR
jgi:protein-tyrosine phosphatase